MVDIINITKIYNNTPVLTDFSMKLNKGEITGFMGESGKGKSTLAKILCGVVKPDKGRVLLNKDILIAENGSYNKSLRPKIQLIPQQPYSALDPKQRVIDAITEPMLQHKIAHNKTIAEDMAAELFKQVWLNTAILYRLPHQISGGQAQRVVIARALGVNPLVLISDEATSMLDLMSSGQILDIYRNLVNKRDVAILFISHNKPLTESLCRKIYTI